MNTNMNLQRIPVEKLKPAKYNPRKDLKPGDAAYEKIKRSMSTFGYVDPVIWNEVTGNIVGGHQRYKVLVAEGTTEIDCVVVHIDSPADEKALNIALNKAVGEWEPVALADLLADLKDGGYDLDVTGFDAAEVDALFNKVLDKDIQEDDFDVDEELKKPCFSKLGDVWHLGRHRVICGDSTLPETFERLMGGTKANLICVDPPYLVSLESASGKIKNDDLNDEKGYEFILQSLQRLSENMANDAAIYMFHADSNGLLFRQAFDQAGYHLGATVIWKKDQLVLTRTDFKYLHEPILYGWLKKGKHKWYGDQKQTTIVEFPRIKNSKTEGCGHPSSKPVPLIAYLVKLSTLTNSVVLDSFLGSASTLMACDQLERICYGVELEPKFVDVAVKRYLSTHEGEQTDVFVVRDGETTPASKIVDGIEQV